MTCGVFPDPTVQCETLLSTAELTTLLGDGPALQSSQGCLWTGAELAQGNTAELAVDVSLGTSQYDRAVAQGSGAAPLSGVGDAATTLDGFATFSDFGGCGRTLVTKHGRPHRDRRAVPHDRRRHPRAARRRRADRPREAVTTA